MSYCSWRRRGVGRRDAVRERIAFAGEWLIGYIAQLVFMQPNAAMPQMKDLVRPEIQALNAYHVADPGALIKLDAMENPYTWPSDMVDEWLALLRDTHVNRYPDPAARQLTERLREAMGIPEGMQVLLGNGSDEIIQMIAMALARPEAVVMAPEPSFVMYRMIATFCNMQYVGVPLKADDFSLDMPAMRAAIDEHRPAVIFLAYPNNPTGNLFSEQDVREIIECAPGVVVVDEAYQAFAETSFMDRLPGYDNLLVMRTVSKLGLAGLRLGFLTGRPEWLNEFDKVRLPYNINELTQVSAELALRHLAVFEQQTAGLRVERSTLLDALDQIEGVTAYSSSANFILFRVPKGRAGEVFAGIKERGVLIKNMGASTGPLADCLRVTVGKPEENQAFLQALREALAQ